MNRLLIVFLFCVLAVGARAQKAKHFVVVPKGAPEPWPVAVWLHGYRGYLPDSYAPGAPADMMQKHADALGAVIIGFPATTDLGDGTQQWAEEPVADHAYVQDRIKTLTKGLKVDLTRVGLFGFSQGAMVAADLASLYPESYRGAILMSAGGLGEPKVPDKKQPAHATQMYFCLCGAEEHPRNVGLTKGYAAHLQNQLGAKVTLKLYEGFSKHARPPDFQTEFPVWMAAILKPAAK